jgi:hypothetical protein
MVDRRIVGLAREIGGLYARSCALADAYNAAVEEETRAFVKAFRARPSAIGELNYFEDVFDRSAALKKALADPRIRFRTGMLQGGLWVLILFVNLQCLAWFGTLTGAVVLTLILGGGGVFLQRKLLIGSETFRRLLREQLVARGVAICVACGYDLRGQIEPRCPECGTRSALPRWHGVAGGEERSGGARTGGAELAAGS